MRNGRSFPPGVSWIPLTLAIAVVFVVSVYAVSPRFQSHTTAVTTHVGGDASGGGGDSSTGGTPAPGTTGTMGPGNGGHGGTTTGSGSGGGTGAQQASGAACASGRNGGSTAPGVTANEIHVATTEVTTGVGAGFLGEAVQGMQAAIDQANNAGGICGRHIVLDHINDSWDENQGRQDISSYINEGDIFALVGEPDSEGLKGAIDSGDIDRAQIPVVGTDGMLADQYFDPYVWPVAASTVTNMHLAAEYAVNVLHAKSFGIVYDTYYKFGKEGATAFDAEIRRLTGQGIPGDGSPGCAQRFCGVDAKDTTDFHNQVQTLNQACQPCDVVVMLLEPGPMEAWMNQEKSASSQWYAHLMGGEPLFDDNLGGQCDTCGGLIVWTGYHPDIQPFDSEKPVYTFAQALKARCPSCDTRNEFTEGAYLGTQLFIAACRQVGPNLTRAALKQALDTMTFTSGLALPLVYGTTAPRVANYAMAAFSDNNSGSNGNAGSFNGWTYMSTGFIQDPARKQDFNSQ